MLKSPDFRLSNAQPTAFWRIQLRCEFSYDDPDWRYELVNGFLIVCPPPLENERDPNEELGHWLRSYRDSHEQGHHLDLTLAEHQVIVSNNRRRADRAIWCGLGRLPRRGEMPTIVVEFVSRGRRNWVLPGFELPLKRLLEFATRWADDL